MEGAHISHVAEALRSDQVRAFPAVDVYIVHSEAKNAWPRKYVYNACRACRKSLEDCFRLCAHHGEKVLAHLASKRYRFDVYISDAVEAVQPIRATIFEAAKVLLGIEAVEFSKWDEQSQDALLCDTIGAMQRCNVNIRVANGQAVIGSLAKQSVGQGVLDSAAAEHPITSVNLTPPSQSCASGSRRKSSGSDSLLKEKVKKVTEILNSTFLEDEHDYLGEEDGIQGSW